ncbi:MAG: hypothetical protein Q9218_000767 [Villophora microphyllina]
MTIRFASLSAKYGFEKPNDRRALDLMNAAAMAVLKEIPDIAIAYGISDEFRSRSHINNLYNTTFWTLVLKGQMGTTEAEEALKGTSAADKNEILFSRFGINYNNEREQFRKGSVIIRDYGAPITKDRPMPSSGRDQGFEPSKTQEEKEKKLRAKADIKLESVDIISDTFWEARPWLLPDS